MEIAKKIETDRYYGKDAQILWIYNQVISDEYPNLFKGFWAVYETWYDHEDQIKQGLSSFLFDTTLPADDQHWKRERFGNYLYGALMSIYFSWESLKSVKPKTKISDIQSNLEFIRHINNVVRYLFTALDAIACCIYIAEDKIPPKLTQEQAEPKHLRMLTIKKVQEHIPTSAYGSLTQLLDRSVFKYLSEYRNLLTHRPFPQFHIDPEGLYHLPESLGQLDSITQREQQYLQSDVGTFLASAFSTAVADIEALLQELDTRYRKNL